jgi:hypothetical protein
VAPGTLVVVTTGAGGLTSSASVPTEPAKLASPEYVPVTVSEPTGALLAEQVPLPALSVAVQSVADPTEMATDPVGVPAPDVTVAEYVTLVPWVTGDWLTPTAVDVGACETLSDVVPTDPA